jgi:predicted DCC family thiol-disulfide oxidoreductase YuxK
MKTLENHTLLYDQDCPLCQVYTSGFIKAGMLDKNGRQPFITISLENQNFIDVKRASNEIALVDNEHKTVIYGIDSLLKVVGVRFSFIEKIGHLKPVKFLLKKLYSFISYNRKVIIPSPENKTNELQCLPSFSIKYRLFYILFSAIVTMYTLFYFFKNSSTLPHGTLVGEGFITFGQLLFQGVLIYTLDKKTILNYFGNVMTISLMGSLMLLPLLIINSMVQISETIFLIGFGITVLIMFIEHSRRVKLLELPRFLSYTWVLYRVLILLTILILN